MTNESFDSWVTGVLHCIALFHAQEIYLKAFILQENPASLQIHGRFSHFFHSWAFNLCFSGNSKNSQVSCLEFPLNIKWICSWKFYFQSENLIFHDFSIQFWWWPSPIAILLVPLICSTMVLKFVWCIKISMLGFIVIW